MQRRLTAHPPARDAVASTPGVSRLDPSPGAGRLDRSAAVPLWQQLLADLRGRLASGEFADGDFPGELTLMTQYAVSRHTVREALRHLRAEGVVSVGRGRRPRVAVAPATAGPTAQPTALAYSLFSSVESWGIEQRSIVRRLQVHADGVVAARLGLEESTPLLHLERLRLADGRPLALDRVWLPASVAAPLLDVDFSRTGLYEQLESTTGIRVTSGQETVRAVVPSAAEHRALDLVEPAAAFSVTRTGCSEGRPIEWRHTLVRTDRFSLVSRLHGAGSAATAAAPGARPTSATAYAATLT